MLKVCVMLAVLVLLCGGAAQASWLSENVTQPVLNFVADTVGGPDSIGVSGGDQFTVDFERQWDVGRITGLDKLDLYGGLTVAATSPNLGGISMVTITNVKKTQLQIGVKTTRAEEARYVVDIPWLFRTGIDLAVAVHRDVR